MGMRNNTNKLMRLKLLIPLLLVGFWVSAQTPIVNPTPWYEYSKKLSAGKIQLKSIGEYDTSFTIPSIAASVTLDTITANKTVTFTNGSSTDKGVVIYVYNSNNSGFTWNVSGSVIESTGGAISTLDRGLHIFYWNSTAWARLSTSGGGAGTVTSISADYGLTGGTITTSGTIKADSNSLATRAILYKVTDSLGAAISLKGTVTSVATGYGALGGTITGAGTVSVDTNIVISRLRDKK